MPGLGGVHQHCLLVSEVRSDMETETSSTADLIKCLDEGKVDLTAYWFTGISTLHHEPPRNFYVATSVDELSLLAQGSLIALTRHHDVFSANMCMQSIRKTCAVTHIRQAAVGLACSAGFNVHTVYGHLEWDDHRALSAPTNKMIQHQI